MFRSQLLFLILILFGTSALAQVSDLESEARLTADILSAKLYAKTDSEKEYCDFVIRQRDQGNLPDRILYAAYRHAVNKEKDRRFTYFQHSLETLCKRENIVLKSSAPKKSSFLPSKATAASTGTTSNSFTSFFQLFRR